MNSSLTDNSQIALCESSEMKGAPVSTQLPQASASTNSAIRAVSSLPTVVSQETGPESSAAAPVDRFPDETLPEKFQGDGAGNQIGSRQLPSTSDFIKQKARVANQRAIVHREVPARAPQSVPPFLSFQCLEIDMSHFQPGVYLLLRENVVVYVGSSVDVVTRVASHRSGWERKDFHRAIFFPCHPAKRLEIEGVLIRFFVPEYNSVVHAPPFQDSDAKIRRQLQIPKMHPELRKLYLEKLKLHRMSRERFHHNHPRAPRKPTP